MIALALACAEALLCGTRHRSHELPRLRAATLEPPAAASLAAREEAGTVAVILMNLGGPETTDDVEPFLYNLFADPDIIRLPPALAGLQTAIAWLVAKRRAPKSRAAYDSIGGGSPILEYTTQQAKLLESRLGPDYKCYVAMRYWHPFTDDAVQKAVADGCTSAVVLPLYPHFSISTTGPGAASGVGPSHNHAVAARRVGEQHRVDGVRWERLRVDCPRRRRRGTRDDAIDAGRKATQETARQRRLLTKSTPSGDAGQSALAHAAPHGRPELAGLAGLRGCGC